MRYFNSANGLNRLILNDVSVEDICGEKIVRELENLSRINIDKDLLKDYLSNHPKERIPMEVVIECPLSDNYKGWKIVDTPGVDAVGGIEDDTRQFLCGKDEDGNHNVDAIIFIQPAKNDMEAKSLNDFVRDTIGSLTEEARKRSFFVLTHASSPDFITRKDEIFGLAKQLFVDYAHVGDDNRLIAVDSLASLLEKDNQLDFKSLVKSKTPVPSHWNSEVWKDCRKLLQHVQSILENDDEVEFNNENTRNKLHELANFDTFRNYLNEFVKCEKFNAFNEIISDIEKDINACIAIREQDIQILRMSLGKSPQEFLEDLENEKVILDKFQIEINRKFQQLSRKYGKSKVDEEFKTEGLLDITPNDFKGMPSLIKMREKAEVLGNKAESVANHIQNNIVKDVKGFVDISQRGQNFMLPPIDYKDIASRVEKKASKESEKTRQVEHRQKITSTGLYIRYWLGKRLGINLGGEKIWYETEHYIDMDAAAISFCNNFKEEINNYRAQIVNKQTELIALIDEDIKSVIGKRKEDYDNMAANTDLVDQINKKEGEIVNLQSALSCFEIYHSIQ